jgi:epoxide hydrolase-like predicted phosphatase
MSNIKAVCFDLWGVLLTLDKREQYRYWAETIGVKVEDIAEGIHLHGAELDRGTMTAREFYTTMADEAGVKTDPKAYSELWHEPEYPGLGVRVELLELSDKLRQAGYRTGILTNLNDNPPGYQKVFNHFDVVVKSFEAHAIKPEPAAYHALLDRLGVAPDEAIFTDDISDNVAGAKHVGMHGIVYKSSNQLIKDLHELGVIW